MLTLRMLPARHGDALVLEYGDAERPRRMLVDGGASSATTAAQLRNLVRQAMEVSGGEPAFERIIVTHIDADHITGVLNLLQDDDVSLTTVDMWFNAWDHLPSDLLGAKQGEALSAAIRRRSLPWNVDFGRRAVMVPEDGTLPRIELADGMVLTLLSPTRTELAALRPVWKKEVEDAGLVPGIGVRERAPSDLLGDVRIDVEAQAGEPFEDDNSAANGASIAFLAEHEGTSLLLTGDARAPVLAAGLRRLAAERGVDRIKVDALKLPHHGSKHNLSRELLALIDCGQFLFSTNGAIYRHPDPVAVSRIVIERADVELFFNYRSSTTQPWDSDRLRRRFRFRSHFPEEGTEGIAVTV